MKKIIFILITLCICLCLSIQSFSLDISTAQEMALHQNPKLKQMEADVKISEASILKSLSPHLPQISLNARHLFSEEFPSQTMTLGSQKINFSIKEPYTNIYLLSTLMIFDGFSTWNQYLAAKSNNSASSSLYEYAKFQIDEDVFIKFNTVLACKALIEVAEQNVITLEKHISDVTSQIHGGIATQLDLLKVEVQLEDAKTELLLAQDNFAIAQSRLTQTLGQEQIERPLNLQGALPVVNKDKILKADLSPQTREDLKAQIQKELSSKSLLGASYGQWAPKISLFLKEELYNYSNHSLAYNDTNYPKRAYAFGLTLTWNIFDGALTYSNNLIASEQIQKTSEELRALTLSVPVDIQNWKRKLIHSAASYQAALVSIKKATESIRLARSAVLAGTRTNTEVLDAERDLYLSKSKMVKAQLEAVEALANLELALGKKLDVF